MGGDGGRVGEGGAGHPHRGRGWLGEQLPPAGQVGRTTRDLLASMQGALHSFVRHQEDGGFVEAVRETIVAGWGWWWG